MADVKFTGVRYDYNDVTIQIASDAIGVSKIFSSGVTIGGAADFDRIMNLQPGEIKVKDDVSKIFYNFTNPVRVTSDMVALMDPEEDYEVDLIKSGNDLVYHSKNFS